MGTILEVPSVVEGAVIEEKSDKSEMAGDHSPVVKEVNNELNDVGAITNHEKRSA